MPELPEVETVTNALRPHLVGRTIRLISVSGLRLRHVVDLHSRTELCGRQILSLRRRSKYILFELRDGGGLLFHLGMSGSFRVEPEGTERRKHDHVIIDLDDETSLRFNDPRRFGIAKYVELDGEPYEFQKLGPEPLEDSFSVAYLMASCSDRKRPIKNMIMDSHIVVGVGNIYASESLFRAGIRPVTPAHQISRQRLKRLHQAIRDVLSDAIRAGGTTIHSFETVDGSEGGFQRHLDVYGLAGETCGTCKRGIIRSSVMAGRTTYYCPVCQR